MDNSLCLVLGVGRSKKDGRAFITYRVWSDNYNTWLSSKNKDGTFGDYFSFIDDKLASDISLKLGEPCLLTAEPEVDGFRVKLGNFQIINN